MDKIVCRYIDEYPLHGFLAEARQWEPQEALDQFLHNVITIFYGMVQVTLQP